MYLTVKFTAITFIINAKSNKDKVENHNRVMMLIITNINQKSIRPGLPLGFYRHYLI